MKIIPATSFWDGPAGKVEDGIVEPIDDAWHPTNHPQYYEWWYFDAEFDGGYSMVTTLFYRDITKMDKPPEPQVLLNIVTPDKSYQRGMNFSLGEFSASKVKCDVRIGNNRCLGEYPEYRLQVSVKGLEVDLTFRSRVPGWKPGTGQFTMGEPPEHYYFWLVPVPQAEVTGTLTVDGKTVEVKGQGYHDHNAGNLGINEVMSYWYWGRFSFDDIVCIFADVFLHPRYGMKRIMPFFLAKGGEKLIGCDGFEILIKDMAEESTIGVPYPKIINIALKDSPAKVKLEIKTKSLMEKRDFIPKNLPPEKKNRILAKILHPSYLRFNSQVNMDIDGKISQGDGIYEIMYLNCPKDHIVG